jgi:hypothetical protein
VLALTPVPLQTAGETALFAELARWDTGGSVRAAVVASLPLTDGPLNRRLSDAVLFVPEGLAVVRVVEVSRQSGVVTARPEGAWSIAPESGPSSTLQLGGGSSSPLDGLMRAGMDVAVRLRKAGLEPGRIARLTVLVGEVTGLVPEDGDLGEGDQVARLEPRSLLLGIARASRYTAVDNPRLWATADVRTALEALGLPGRGPSVEELNGEGFPYSPYVLRRPGLMMPAAMAANSTNATESGAERPPVPEPAATPESVERSEAEIPAGAAEPRAGHPPRTDATVSSSVPAPAPSVQPSVQAQVPVASPPVSGPPSPAVYAGQPRQDTVQIDGPESAQTNDSGGIGGLFTNAEPLYAQAGPSAAAPTAPPPPPAAPPTPATSVFAPPPAGPMPPLRRPVTRERHSDEDVDDDAEPSGRGRTVLLALLGLAVVLGLGFLGWSILGDRTNGGSDAGPSAGATSTAAAGPEVGAVQEIAGVAYTLQAEQVDDTCVGHSYGDTADFFATTNCTGVARALYSADLAGGPVVVSVSRVQMADPQAARNLQALTDRNGSGNISDLLREGVRYTGSPDKLSSAEYASALSGSTVTIVESAWVDPGAGGSDADIDTVASNGLALETQPVPGS